MTHFGDAAAALELDYDCDFLMDCEGDEGLREVLHLLCATPRPGPCSPRAHTPRRVPSGFSVGAAHPPLGSPLRSSVEESNLRYLSQFHDASLNQLLNVLSATSNEDPVTVLDLGVSLPSATSVVWRNGSDILLPSPHQSIAPLRPRVST